MDVRLGKAASSWTVVGESQEAVMMMESAWLVDVHRPLLSSLRSESISTCAVNRQLVFVSNKSLNLLVSKASE